MGKQKAVFGVWSEIKVSDLNRLLKPHGLRLVAKGSKAWGPKVTVTVEAAGDTVIPAFRAAEADALLRAGVAELAGEYEGDRSALEAACERLRFIVVAHAPVVQPGSSDDDGPLDPERAGGLYEPIS